MYLSLLDLSNALSFYLYSCFAGISFVKIEVCKTVQLMRGGGRSRESCVGRGSEGREKERQTDGERDGGEGEGERERGRRREREESGWM